MNLDSLKNIKIDLDALKRLSFDDVRNFINEQQVLALNIAIALSALTLGVYVINMRFHEYAELKTNLDAVVVKEEPAHEYDKALKDKRLFLRDVPAALSEEEVIPYFTQLADKHNIIINEFQPPYERIEGFFYEVRVVFVCSVANFQDAMLFVHDIENSKYMLKVNSWSFNPKEKELSEENLKSKTELVMSLDISSMRLMEK